MRTLRAPAVGHLDADCFYVPAERVRDEFLRDKPVGVLGNQGACVIAKSYEMKHQGVQTGMPIWEAVVKCPQGIYLKRDRALAQLKRAVNARYGRFALRSGATLPLYAIYQDEANSFDICDVRGKMCF
jgi:nucleotidyltransferase/DNA polymerase involved in DNA repair